MFYCAIVICLLSSRALASSNSCENLDYKECEIGDFPDELPQNEEEMDAYCEFSLHYFECGYKKLEECDQLEDNRVYPEFLAFFKHACNKESLMYKALLEHLPCISPTVTGGEIKCYKKGRADENLESFQAMLPDEGITEVSSGGENSTIECLRHLFMMSCMSAYIGKDCGEMAKDIAVEIFRHLDFVFEPCKPGIKDKFPDIIKVLQMEYEEEAELEKAFDKK